MSLKSNFQKENAIARTLHIYYLKLISLRSSCSGTQQFKNKMNNDEEQNTHSTKIKQHKLLKNLYNSYIYAVNHMQNV